MVGSKCTRTELLPSLRYTVHAEATDDRIERVGDQKLSSLRRGINVQSDNAESCWWSQSLGRLCSACWIPVAVQALATSGRRAREEEQHAPQLDRVVCRTSNDDSISSRQLCPLRTPYSIGVTVLFDHRRL